jgi:hypothetical protein
MMFPPAFQQYLCEGLNLFHKHIYNMYQHVGQIPVLINLFEAPKLANLVFRSDYNRTACGVHNLEVAAFEKKTCGISIKSPKIVEAY